MRHTLLLLWIVCVSILSTQSLSAQTQVDLRTQAKGIDFTGATATKPFKSGLALPATCGTGELFFNTSAPAGVNVYACTSTNTWTVEGGNGAVMTGSGAPSGPCTIGQLYYDTTNLNTWFCESPATWLEALLTTGSGAFVLTGQAGTTPAAPTTGSTSMFFNSATSVAQTIDSLSNVGTMVRPTDCSANSQVVQKLNADGTVTCAGLSAVQYSFPGGFGSSASPQPGPWWQDGTTTTVCPTGTPFQCSLRWNSGSSLIALTVAVPAGWTTGAASVSLTFQGNGSGNTVQPAVASGCVNSLSTGFSFNPAQNFPSQVTSGNTFYVATLPALTMTGCSAGSTMVLQFSRVDTGGFMNLTGASILFNLP
jgi:hypothetical protein